jgi:hypothetical protein
MALGDALRPLAREGSTMRWNRRVLGSAQERALRALGRPLSRRGFYLGGGTAVALHLGHRRSYDLDWFTGERIGDAATLLAQLRGDGVRLSATHLGPGTLHGSLYRTRVSLLEYRYPALKTPLDAPGLRCRVASLEDLACMKLSAVAQRGSRKDFVDGYAIARERIPLAGMLSLYVRRYHMEDFAHVLYGLAYFDDADRERMPVMLWDVSWSQVKRAIRDWVSQIATKGR